MYFQCISPYGFSKPRVFQKYYQFLRTFFYKDPFAISCLLLFLNPFFYFFLSSSFFFHLSLLLIYYIIFIFIFNLWISIFIIWDLKTKKMMYERQHQLYQQASRSIEGRRNHYINTNINENNNTIKNIKDLKKSSSSSSTK